MCFCKQIPGGNLFRCAGMKIDFPIYSNRRVKSVPGGLVDVSYRQNGVIKSPPKR